MPLTEDTCGVAGPAEDFGQRDFFRVHHRPADVGVDGPRAIVVSARHQARPGRRADGMHVEVGHRPAATRHRVNVRRSDDRIAGDAQIAVALIVGDDQNDVRPVFGTRAERHRGTRRAQQRRAGAHTLEKITA